ncbi:MAG: DNA pilot protein [Microvirus sp.]|nr:MAG: DNA pilot protein [Microvirus sp.]
MFDIGAMIGGLAQMGGGIYQANKNYESQRDTNAMQVNLANTAVQRRQADMAKAGINPLLAADQGGAQTPTLQAPQMQGIGESLARGAETFTTRAQQALQQQAMDIERTKADTEKIQAEREKANAEAAYSRILGEWAPPKTQQEIAESQSRQTLMGHEGEAAQAAAALSRAETNTKDALRDPTVQNLLAETAAKIQTNKTEMQRTKEAEAAAKYADETYGAKASEAKTKAAQLAAYYKNFFLTAETQKIAEKDLTIAILTNDKLRGTMENLLTDEFGKMREWSKIMQGPIQLGAQLGGPKGPVIKK